MTSESRFTHVIRIVGQDRDGNRIPDIWVDIERQDIVWINYKEKATGQWQGQFTRLYWMDDPDGDGGATWNADNRLIGTRYICSPEENSYDPEEFIAVNCIIAFVASQSGQTIVQGIRSDSSNETRLLSARRIYHRSVEGDFEQDAERAFSNDSNRFAYVVAGPDYTLAMEDGDKDESQWIDVCVAAQSAFANHDGDFEQQINGHWSDYLLSISDKTSDFLPDDNYPNAIGDLGFNPPWVLDQFQNIVNVQLESLDNTFVILSQRGDMWTSVDGYKWEITDHQLFYRGKITHPLQDPRANSATTGAAFGRWDTKNAAFMAGGASSVTVIAGGDLITQVRDCAVCIASYDGYKWFDVPLPDQFFAPVEGNPSTTFSINSYGSHSRLMSSSWDLHGDAVLWPAEEAVFVFPRGPDAYEEKPASFVDADPENVPQDSYVMQRDGFKEFQNEADKEGDEYPGFGSYRMRTASDAHLEVSADRGTTWIEIDMPGSGLWFVVSACRTFVAWTGGTAYAARSSDIDLDNKKANWIKVIEITESSNGLEDAITAIATGKVPNQKKPNQ